MVHCLFMLWTYSAFVLHLLATYYFLVFIAWSLSAASSPSVSPFRLLDNHMLVMTVSLWGFSRILGYWPCNALFFHFYSFKMIPSWTLTCVLGLDHFLSDLSSRFSNSGIVTSLMNLLAFLVIEMLALDLSRSCTSLVPELPFFVLQIVIEPYCCCFECFFYLNQIPPSIFFRDVQPLHICFRM